jgi:hypothetical protein
LSKKSSLTNIWSEYGHIYSSSIDTNTKSEKEDSTKIILDEIHEIREMMIMLNRDKNLEKKYPKLKEAADEYKRLLEKYKTFDILKGK